MKRLKRIALLLMVLVTALAGAAGWLGGTTSGLRFLAGLAAPRLPVTLDPATIEGRLIGPIELGRVEFAAPGLRAELAGAALDWRPGALLLGTVHVTELRLTGLRLELLEPGPGGGGEPFALPFDVVVDRLVLAGGALHDGGELVVSDVDLEVSGRASGRTLALQELVLTSSRGGVAGEARISLDPAQAWDLDLRWTLPLAATELAGHTRARGPLAELEVSQHLSAPLDARLEGVVRGLPGRPSWAVDLAVEPLPPGGDLWPEALAGLAARLRVDGDLGNSSIAGDFELPRHLPGRTGITARAGWLDDVVRLDSLALSRDDGARLQGSGTIGAEAVDLEFDFAGLDPAAFLPEWPGRLAGAVRLSGLPAAAGGLDVSLRSLHGELRAVPLAGEADLNIAADRYLLRQARIAAGDASLRASGQLDAAAVALAATLEVPALGALHPDAAGRLAASVRVAGSRQAPTLELEATGQDLRWQSRPIGSLRLVADGSPQAHRARVQLERPELDQAFRLDLEGALAERRWDALLTDILFSAQGRPAWSLQAPARLAADTESVSLGAACMDGAFGLLCLEGDWRRAGPLRGSATLTGLDLAPLSERFSPSLLATGVLSGDVEIEADGERFQALAGKLELGAGELRLADEEDEALLTWTRGLLELTGDEAAARATLDLALADPDHVEGRLALGWNRPDLPLAGRIDATLDQVHVLTAFVPELAELQGNTTLQAAIGGTLRAPAVEAELALRDGSVNMPRLGLRPDRIEALVTLAGRELGFTITGRSGEGLFRTEGRFDLAAEGVTGRATLSGEQLLLVNLAEARMTASPDLEFRYAGRDLEISGDVAIPFARITELGGPATVPTSPDEVLVGAYVPVESQGMRITSRVRVTVGPDVQVDAAGLRGSVEGSILTVIQPDALPWGRGELRVVGGTFGAFGQRLEIQQGRLIYTGGPLDNPGLEIRAVRQLEEVTAGALIRGTLQQPEISVYSDPPLPQAEALAYLTLGRSLADLRAGEQRAVSQAANSLALSGGNLIAKDLGQRLGFAEVALAAESEGTSLVVSRYLGGGIYVAYGIGLFDTVNTLRLRLQVNRRLSLETISGDEHAGDLFYTFERD